MKAVQVVGVLITLVQLGSVVGFGLSLHTMAGVVMGEVRAARIPILRDTAQCSCNPVPAPARSCGLQRPGVRK